MVRLVAAVATKIDASVPVWESIGVWRGRASAHSMMAIEKNDRVIHGRFGSGTVIAVDDNKITIAFDSGAHRQIASAWVIRWGGCEVKLSGALMKG